MVQGLGGVFLEHFVYDDERHNCSTGSFADYLLPTASDFPSIRAVALEAKALAATIRSAPRAQARAASSRSAASVANAVAAALSPLQRSRASCHCRRRACG